MPGRVPNLIPVPIGAHVSISGRIYDAVPRAQALGCECLQIFYGSPRQWRLSTYSREDLEEFRRRQRASGLDPLVAHTSYLINLASPDRSLYRRSVVALTHTLQGMDALGGLAAITHIGSPHGRPWPDARARIAWALRAALRKSSRAMILLEGSAGGSLGGTFEQLREILDEVGETRRLGVCLDTAHLFASGWDIRTPAGVDGVAGALDRAIDLRRLRALHLNDSKAALGSHLDRHENIGAGAIGHAGFRAILAHPAFRNLPGFLETPGFDQTGPDMKNLAILKRLREQSPRAGSPHAASLRPASLRAASLRAASSRAASRGSRGKTEAKR